MGKAGGKNGGKNLERWEENVWRGIKLRERGERSEKEQNKIKQMNKQKPQVRRLIVGDVGPEQTGRGRIEVTPHYHCKQDEQSLWSWGDGRTPWPCLSLWLLLFCMWDHLALCPRWDSLGREAGNGKAVTFHPPQPFVLAGKAELRLGHCPCGGSAKGWLGALGGSSWWALCGGQNEVHGVINLVAADKVFTAVEKKRYRDAFHSSTVKSVTGSTAERARRSYYISKGSSRDSSSPHCTLPYAVWKRWLYWSHYLLLARWVYSRKAIKWNV